MDRFAYKPQGDIMMLLQDHFEQHPACGLGEAFSLISFFIFLIIDGKIKLEAPNNAHHAMPVSRSFTKFSIKKI